MSETRPEIGDYYVVKSIGSGSYGKVKLAEHKETGQKVAIKIVKKSLFMSAPEMQEKIQREISIMRLLDHPHLLKLVDVYESVRHLYIILEYAAHGELFDFLVERGSFSVEMATYLFRQLIYGLEFLHIHQICHRDIKPENILLDAHDNVKIADFGFARWMPENTAYTACGSPHYTAPEVIIGLPYDGRAADIWSCGVVFYTLMCGRLPFDEPTVRKLLARVRSGKYQMPDFPMDIKDLITKMLTVDPSKRITLPEIKNHPAFRIGLSPLYRCPSPQPIPQQLPPLDIAKIPPESMLVLHQLGFTDEELERDLTCEDHTVAKEFCYMLDRLVSFDSIQWPEKVEYVPDSMPLMMPAERTISASSSTDSLTEKPPTLPSLSSCYSAIEHSMLSLDIPTMPSIIKHSVETQAPQETVANAIQQFLDQERYAFIFPDDLTFFVRGNSLDFVIRLRIVDVGILSVEVVLVAGNIDLFDQFFEKLSGVIESIII
ncbi:CAMK family protein kinase [Trichomonas vaginalis G3]|uniref:CAMK family protein kinase n=1 Tax=Trichomonas vaginalis (strain ATCC PRA-98 / G3) TaxID=412133 RepID=A2DBY9_TRIV3|nr:protein serine/threonine kinase protein [Trichomonas vaginalis G3]EAY22030.1 CAMK family protein kinase [Trichomonas vaginalis G3]KAI5525345.1 protein serine/threonine kinase protein [Trichomonas vaginalis G3]|eukprot:XP_001583016.1 CAMK family protein kinase [Trichomonas vaginalis G3]